MACPPCFDAVLFDLDGTLVATDRFWIESARRGASRAFRELGLARPLPSAAQWMSLVGMPLEIGFRSLFPELAETERRIVLAACIEEEEALLRQGAAVAMPGAREVLLGLHQQGLALGIASNCQQSYLDHMLDALELRALVRGAYCRESAGIISKGDMLARLLADFGTRSAVMVGDRESDRDAAWENGIPHVHCAFGFAQGDEAVEAEGRISALGELAPLLARRARWIDRALERLDLPGRPGLRLAITGGPAAGKTLFARDLARRLVARGRPAAGVSLADFAPGRADPDADPLGAAVDLARLERELLRPHAEGREVALRSPDLLGQARVSAGAVLVLEGSLLLGARQRLGLDRLVHLRLPEALSQRRLLGRDARQDEAGIHARSREAALTLQRALERRHPPASSADLVLDGENPLGWDPGDSTAAGDPPVGGGLGAGDRTR